MLPTWPAFQQYNWDTILKNYIDNHYGAPGSNTLYVRADGSDSNDGTAPTRAYREIRAAAEAITGLGPFLRGSWTIDVGPGTYKGGISFDTGRGRAQDDLIRIKGSDVGSHPNVPTVIIDKAADPAATFAIKPSNSVSVRLDNLKIQGDFAYGIDARYRAYVYLGNVHGLGGGKTGSGIFFNALDHVEYYCVGGIVDGWNTGFQEHFGVIRHFELATSTATGTQVRNCANAHQGKENCVGHLDYLQIDGCDIGIELHGNSVANSKGVAISNSGVGFCIANSEVHNESSVTFSNVTRPWVTLGASQELTYFGWTGDNQSSIGTGHRPLMLLKADYADHAVTGVTAETTISSFPTILKGGMYSIKGKRFEVHLVGSVNTLDASSTGVRLILRVAGTNVVETLIPPGAVAGADFEARFVVICAADGNTQRIWSTISGYAPGLTAYRGGTVDLSSTSTGKSVAVSCIPNNAADSITFHVTELWG